MRLVSKIYHFVVDPKIPTLSGALCFFLLLNGGSYLFLFVSISSFFFIDYTQYINSLSDGIVKDIILYLLQYNSNLSISIFLLCNTNLGFIFVNSLTFSSPMIFVISTNASGTLG